MEFYRFLATSAEIVHAEWRKGMHGLQVTAAIAFIRQHEGIMQRKHAGVIVAIARYSKASGWWVHLGRCSGLEFHMIEEKQNEAVLRGHHTEALQTLPLPHIPPTNSETAIDA